MKLKNSLVHDGVAARIKAFNACAVAAGFVASRRVVVVVTLIVAGVSVVLPAGSYYARASLVGVG